MIVLSDRNYASLFLNGASLLILIGTFVSTSIYRKRGHFDDRLFANMLITDMLLAILDSLVAIANRKSFPGAELMNILSLSAFYMLQAIFALEIVLYLYYRLVKDPAKVKKLGIWATIPIGLILLMYIIGLPQGYFFAIDENNAYYYARFYWIPVIIMALYVVVAFILVFLYRMRNVEKRNNGVWIFLVPIVAGGVIPYVFKGISMSAVCLAIILVFIHMGVMNEAFFSEEELRYLGKE